MEGLGNPKGIVLMATRIYYDGDCPFCSNYVQFLRLREASGPVEIIDLRKDLAALKRFQQEGLNPDKGMIVETPSGTFHGADAMNILSMMSTGIGWLNAGKGWSSPAFGRCSTTASTATVTTARPAAVRRHVEWLGRSSSPAACNPKAASRATPNWTKTAKRNRLRTWA